MKLYNYIYILVAGLMLCFAGASCTPEKFEAGAVDVSPEDLVEGIAFSITHDASNPNIIYLKSLMDPSYLALWEHPQGRSEGSEVTLKMPFAGTYEVTFGVQTRGGVVYGEPTTFKVDDFCADFVSDDLWTYLSGGVGNSKKWVLDTDADGLSRYFAGPVTFYGLDDSWETVTGGETVDGDSWSWGASYSDVAGWQFPSYNMDWGYMEFDLNGGSNVHVVMNDLDYDQTGTYMLDTDNHTISFTDCQLLHDSTNDSQVAAWSGTMKLLSLTETYMQIAVERVSDPCLLSFNFISEDYRDSWTPGGTGEVETPTLADDWRDYVEPKTNKVITYTLSEDNPYDWCSLDGSRLGIGGSFDDSALDMTFELNSGEGTYTLTTPEGEAYTGTYELSNDGVYTFSDALPTVAISSDVTFRANSDNTLRILSYETDDYTGALTDLWLGSEISDDQGNLFEYMGYHFCPQTAGDDSGDRFTAILEFFDTGWAFQDSGNVYITGDGYYTFTIYGSSDSPYGIYLDIYKILSKYPYADITITDIQCDGNEVSFDDSVIDRGVGDESDTGRRYILNPWGATADDGPNYVFTSTLSVTAYVEFDTGEVKL
ncbi:MAG: hypothetical protein LUC24_04075 [Bacteroidales bacterium]|nr:hypothetical protein [Bacteroidales bacterium]